MGGLSHRQGMDWYGCSKCELPCTCTPLSIVILSDRRESKNPEGHGLASIAQALFYLDCMLARPLRLEMDTRPSPVQAFSGSLVSPLRYEVFVPGKSFDSLRSLRMTIRKVLLDPWALNPGPSVLSLLPTSYFLFPTSCFFSLVTPIL